MMGGRLMPVECEHGKVLDWGDFGGAEDAEECEVCSARQRQAERDRAWELFVAGFECSAEGFNAEWPFGDHGIDPRDSEAIKAMFDHWWSTR